MSWPELVGIDGEKAAEIIERENPSVRTVIVEEGMVVTMDFRCERVRVWVDKKHGLVIEAPHMG